MKNHMPSKEVIHPESKNKIKAFRIYVFIQYFTFFLYIKAHLFFSLCVCAAVK